MTELRSITIRGAKRSFGALMMRVAIDGEFIIIKSMAGKDLALLVPMSDPKNLLEQVEDCIAIVEAEKALNDPRNQGKPIPWKTVQAKLRKKDREKPRKKIKS